MDSFKIIQKELHEIKSENRRLKVMHPHACVSFSFALILVGLASKSMSIQMLSLSLTMLSVMNWKEKANIENKIRQNNKAYFHKAVDLNFAIQDEVCKIMQNLSIEKNPIIRKKWICLIRQLKKENIIRQEDKKVLLGCHFHKRKRIARGLKTLRQHMNKMSFEAYLRQRENILSYY